MQQHFAAAGTRSALQEARTTRARPADATAWLGDATEPGWPPPLPPLEAARMPAGAVAVDSAPLLRPLRLHSWSTSCRRSGRSPVSRISLKTYSKSAKVLKMAQLSTTTQCHIRLGALLIGPSLPAVTAADIA